MQVAEKGMKNSEEIMFLLFILRIFEIFVYLIESVCITEWTFCKSQKHIYRIVENHILRIVC